MVELQLGDFNDNNATFSRLLAAIGQGDEGAREGMRQLQKHIIATGEAKSRVWLLARIEAMLRQKS